MFLVYALLSVLISSVNAIEELLVFTGQLLTTNVVAVAVMLFVAYSVAISTFRRGLNPDNFVIPVESSLADTVTTAAALLALALIV
jgi:cation transporter-like permease